MQLVIVAGGKGTRLRERLGQIPKPMAEVGGTPLLEHQVLLARRYGFDRILLLLGYSAAVIADYFGDGARWGVRIDAIIEEQPLGSAGAVLGAFDALADRFAVMYGDTMLNVDLSRLLRAHQRSGADASLVVHPNDHPHDSDLVEIDSAGRIIAFHPYPHNPEEYYPNLVNAALYMLEKRALEHWRDAAGPLDFGKHLFPAMLADGGVLYAYRTPEYIKDAGTAARLDAVTADYNSGRIGRGSLETPAPAVFLDRDGTINEEVNRVAKAEQLMLFQDAATAIRMINQSGCRAIVITNQPVVARGECTERELARIHNKMETLLGREGAYVDGIFWCPHHPDRGFAGERPELKIRCECRKPGIALIQRACDTLNLDLAHSWLIGDSTVDVRTAKNADLRSVLVQTGHAGRDGRYPDEPDYVAPTLTAAVRLIQSLRSGHSST